jgi:hypothetical protein
MAAESAKASVLKRNTFLPRPELPARMARSARPWGDRSMRRMTKNTTNKCRQHDGKYGVEAPGRAFPLGTGMPAVPRVSQIRWLPVAHDFGKTQVTMADSPRAAAKSSVMTSPASPAATSAASSPPRFARRVEQAEA